MHNKLHPRDLVTMKLKLFTDGNFDCNLDGILQFWDMVKSDTFKLCDTTYFLNQQRIESCKEGTATYTREKANVCSTDEDCKNLGDIAGKAVSDRFCQVVNSADIPSNFSQWVVKELLIENVTLRAS